MSDDLSGQPRVGCLQEVMAALPGLESDRLELLALELQRAGASLVPIMAQVVVTAILGATAWVALCSGLGLLLVAKGLSWPLALLTVLLVNLALAWVAVTRARRLVVNLGLPTTVTQSDKSAWRCQRMSLGARITCLRTCPGPA